IGICIIKAHQKTVHTSMASWNESYATFEEAYASAQLAAVGTVKSKESYELHDVIFTRAVVEVSEVFRGDEYDTVTVIFTGGEKDGEIYELAEQKIPETGKTYLFLLRALDTPGEFREVGGYRGVYRVSETNTYSANNMVIKPFNEDNDFEGELKNKTLSQILTK
ncbi:MAG: hypothetical protein PUF72_07000, partial [Clostridiales bacterium]|nr:hypothetical protein [Clostridiales bacterium]